ncbi:hypothetical protein OGAPHI_004695 [Ogataea philodendri]|uniref:Uncharacterized protein n=1 Tax=Ogataea philodendri TaxID=1378263 RepID=A0A9P8T3N1_9ASCO|nr:uncharacterized protein OGAPHI_004695 [Ogataea philodendri]KAH3663981.1 hypothetical protein OGAPHI_004695 [Ogataea philodendri]
MNNTDRFLDTLGRLTTGTSLSVSDSFSLSVPKVNTSPSSDSLSSSSSSLMLKSMSGFTDDEMKSLYGWLPVRVNSEAPSVSVSDSSSSVSEKTGP